VFRIQVVCYLNPTLFLMTNLHFYLGEPFLAWHSDCAGNLFSLGLNGQGQSLCSAIIGEKGCTLGRGTHGQVLFQEKGKGQLTAFISCSDTLSHTYALAYSFLPCFE